MSINLQDDAIVSSGSVDGVSQQLSAEGGITYQAIGTIADDINPKPATDPAQDDGWEEFWCINVDPSTPAGTTTLRTYIGSAEVDLIEEVPTISVLNPGLSADGQAGQFYGTNTLALGAASTPSTSTQGQAGNYYGTNTVTLAAVANLQVNTQSTAIKVFGTNTLVVVQDPTSTEGTLRVHGTNTVTLVPLPGTVGSTAGYVGRVHGENTLYTQANFSAQGDAGRVYGTNTVTLVALPGTVSTQGDAGRVYGTNTLALQSLGALTVTNVEGTFSISGTNTVQLTPDVGPQVGLGASLGMSCYVEGAFAAVSAGGGLAGTGFDSGVLWWGQTASTSYDTFIDDVLTVTRVVRGLDPADPITGASLSIRLRSAQSGSAGAVFKKITTTADNKGHVFDDGASDTVGVLQFELSKSDITKIGTPQHFVDIRVTTQSGQSHTLEAGTIRVRYGTS